MFLRRIELRRFRNFDRLSYAPSPAINCFFGPNGAGKTNLAEAIYSLALAKGWRTKETAPLIKWGEESAVICAEVVEGSLTRKIKLIFQKGARSVFVDGKPLKKLSELNSVANVLLFSPEDVDLFKGPPGRRRAFLDVSISKRDAKYFGAIMRYGKLLEERNAALKNETPNPDLLDAITEQMIAECETISFYRHKFVEETNRALQALAASLYGSNEALTVAYRPFVPLEGFKSNAARAYKESRETDLRYRHTSIGPHKEDFSACLNGKDLALYGSQGQNRIAAIALKISPAFLPQEAPKKPIVVLDDVLGELDETHARRLLETIRGAGQTFITSANAEIPQASTLRLGVQ